MPHKMLDFQTFTTYNFRVYASKLVSDISGITDRNG